MILRKRSRCRKGCHFFGFWCLILRGFCGVDGLWGLVSRCRSTFRFFTRYTSVNPNLLLRILLGYYQMSTLGEFLLFALSSWVGVQAHCYIHVGHSQTQV